MEGRRGGKDLECKTLGHTQENGNAGFGLHVCLTLLSAARPHK